MSIVVLDTNLVSYKMRKSSFIEKYEPHFVGQKLAISFMTVAELYKGACRAFWGLRKLNLLKSEIGKYLVVESTPEICRHWGGIRNERRRRTISTDDAWIAATARANGWPLATHNARDFMGISGLEIITEP